MISRMYLRIFMIVFAVWQMVGCGGDITPEGPALLGSYRACEYTRGLSNSGYASATISYPCDTAQGPFPATTVIGGATNVKSQMTWLSDNLTSHGIIVIRLTPNNPFGSLEGWETAQRAGYEQLIIENRKGSSPITGLVNENAIGLIGYSNGGRGAIKVANELGDKIKAVVGLAPYNPSPSSWKSPNMSAATLIAIGNVDTTAFPINAKGQFNGLPDSIPSLYAELVGSGHLDFINGGGNHSRYLTLVTSWMTLHLAGDDRFATYLFGDKYDELARTYSEYIVRN